jgi:hypothetical protein
VYKYLTVLALVPALTVWIFSQTDYVAPPPPAPPPEVLEIRPPQLQPGYIGTMVVKGVEVHLFDRPATPPPARVPDERMATAFHRTGSMVNAHNAWAGLTGAMFGPLVAITGIMIIWLTFIGGRRLMYRRI